MTNWSLSDDWRLQLGKYRNQPTRGFGRDSDLRLIGPVTTWCEYRGRGDRADQPLRMFDWVMKKDTALKSATKEVVGIRTLLTHSLFASGIPRRLLLRVSPAKPTSALLRF